MNNFSETQKIQTEIERKFLIKKTPEDLHKYKSHKILQGYIIITKDGTELRLRQNGEYYFQTIKSGEGLERKETEIELSIEQFNKLWPLAGRWQLRKKRFEILYEDVKIELDIYDAPFKGLIMGEVEFKTVEDSERFSPPNWFGKEITNDERFKNRNLAKFGIPAIL